MLRRYSLYLLMITALLFNACSSEEDPLTPNNGSDPMVNEPMGDGEKAPDFSINTTGGKNLKLGQFEDKVLVIFFFGADCPPCRRVGPDVEEKLNKAFSDNNKFAMIGADQWNRNDAAVDDFVDATGITFDVGIQGADMAKDYGTTFDRIVVLNDQSEIVYRSPSRASGRLQEAIDVVSDLLK